MYFIHVQSVHHHEHDVYFFNKSSITYQKKKVWTMENQGRNSEGAWEWDKVMEVHLRRKGCFLHIPLI